MMAATNGKNEYKDYAQKLNWTHANCTVCSFFQVEFVGKARELERFER